MRTTVLTFAVATLAVGLTACGKPSTRTQGTQAASGAQPGSPAATKPAELSDEDQKKILASLPAPYNAADLANGRTKFSLCAACHTITPGGPNMTGPNLNGVIGRKAGSVANFSYSDAVKNAGFTWDAAHLDKWLTDPKGYLPGTKMTFVGLKNPKDRTDLIAYLMVESGSKPH